MDLPTSLPARLYLLACDRDKSKVVPRDQIGYAVRAAALIELAFAGAITEDPRRPTTTGALVTDEFEAGVLAELADSRPHSWGHWVKRRPGQARDEVRDQLVAARWIGVERHRALGVFPVERITVRDVAAHQAFVTRTARLVRGIEPVTRVHREDAALISLAAGAELRTALSREDRRKYKKRIEELTAVVGPAAPALRTVIRQLHTQRTTAGAGGGGG